MKMLFGSNKNTNFDFCVQSYDDAVAILSKINIDEINDDCYDIVCWIECKALSKELKPLKFKIKSKNKEKMYEIQQIARRINFYWQN